MRLDARPSGPLVQPVVLRHRLRLARLLVGGDQEQDIRAPLRQHAPDLGMKEYNSGVIDRVTGSYVLNTTPPPGDYAPPMVGQCYKAPSKPLF